jgi:hypothetical protein
MWLYVPFQYVRGLEDSTSDSESPSQALEQSVTWRGKHSESRVWSQRWSKGGWIRLLSGLTLEPSTAARGVKQWIASLLDCPVSPTALLEQEKDTTTNGQSGPSSSGLSKSVSPPWSFSRTSLHLFSTFDQSESDYQHWATGLRLEYSRRLRSGRRIGESDSLLWPTPMSAPDSEASHAQLSERFRQGMERAWPTPDAAASTRSNRSPSEGATVRPLLAKLVQDWNTPTSRDWKDDGLTDETATNSLLGRQVQRTEIHGSESSPSVPTSRRRLNPKFVEWLMGLPPGWTAFEPVEMGSWLSRQRMRLRSLLGDSD